MKYIVGSCVRFMKWIVGLLKVQTAAADGWPEVEGVTVSQVAMHMRNVLHICLADCNLAVRLDHWGFKASNLTNPSWKAPLVWRWSGGLLGSPFLKKNFYGLFPGWIHEIKRIRETFRLVWQVRRTGCAHFSDVCLCSNTPDLNNPQIYSGNVHSKLKLHPIFFLSHSLYPPWTIL